MAKQELAINTGFRRAETKKGFICRGGAATAPGVGSDRWLLGCSPDWWLRRVAVFPIEGSIFRR